MQGWEAVRAWRKAQRARLLAGRQALPPEERARSEAAISALLAPLLAPRDGVWSIGFYWPVRGEYDPRPVMRSLHAMGRRPLLPVVVERGRPCVFREWWPGIRMVAGPWDIPVPAEGAAVLPDAVVAPVVGFDGRGYRLGYGGGYYDRTLAALQRRPLAIGVGFALSRLETIHPQPHDIPMDLIVTERAATPGAAALAWRLAASVAECAE